MNNIRKPFRYNNFGAVYWLIGINVLIFAAMWLMGPRFQRNMIVRMSMVPALVKEGWVWTFITYMFLHANLTHILFNMLGLFIFGIQVEREIGSKEFLLYYLLTGIMAGVFSFVVYSLSKNDGIFLMGASGALFAVELAYAVIHPDSIIYLWGILPMRAPVMVLGYTALELVLSITRSSDGVAHFTHLAGFGFGWIYFLIRFGVNPWRRLIRR